MHILTGMIVAALLGKKKDGTSKPNRPRFLGGPVEIAHTIPGRVRFHVPSLCNNESAAALLNDRLSKIEKAYRVVVSPQTGSVLIRFDPDVLCDELLLAAIIRLLGLEKEFEHPPVPVVTRELRNAGSSLNRAVFEKTHGIVDLWTAVMILMGAVGVRKIMMQPAMSLPAGFTLVYWAVNAFRRKG